mmetsp:Transcript_3861/g.7406  ORF Transcript_3861/g.7406 Transcript_3861/m.7406 type:complete len:217 (+) Transcript_3861:1083-1733(+)
MNSESTSMGAVSSDDIKLFNIHSFDKTQDFFKVKTSSRTTQYGSTYVMNIFNKFRCQFNRGIRRIIESFVSTTNPIHLAFDTVHKDQGIGYLSNDVIEPGAQPSTRHNCSVNCLGIEMKDFTWSSTNKSFRTSMHTRFTDDVSQNALVGLNKFIVGRSRFLFFVRMVTIITAAKGSKKRWRSTWSRNRIIVGTLHEVHKSIRCLALKLFTQVLDLP